MDKKGKVAVLDKVQGHFTVKEYPLPDVSPETLLVRIEYCGVCGTDVHTYYGKLADAPFPVVLGHEIAGTIVDMGSQVEKDFLGKPVKVGDRIILVPAIHCKKCYYCTIAKTPSKCLNMISYGFLPLREPYFTGGYAEYLYLFHPKTEFFKIDAPPEVTLFAEPLAIAIHAVDRARIKTGQSAVIQGTGAIGLLTLICAKAAGATRVAVVGRRRKERLELAKELGADLAINMEEIPDAKERIRIIKDFSTTGYGADVVFECAGVPQAFWEGIQYLRESATLCEVGHFTDTGKVEINPCKDILEKNITVEGIYDNEADHFARALPMLEKRIASFESMISHRLPLDRLQEVVEAIAKGDEIDGRAIIKAVVQP